MCVSSDYKLSVSSVNPLMSFTNGSPLMSFMIPERKSGLYRQMLNVLKIYILSVKFDCIVLCYLSGRNLVPVFFLFCNKEPKLKLP